LVQGFSKSLLPLNLWELGWSPLVTTRVQEKWTP